MSPFPDFVFPIAIRHLDGVGRMSKPVSWRHLVRRLRTLGFDGPYWGTKHPFMVRGSFKLRIPRDHGTDIGASLLSEMLRQAGIRREEWEQST